MDFTQRLLDKFDSKYRELHIRQIAQIKQTDMVDSYMIEFHRLEVMVSDVSESWLIMLFVEGLSEPLHGWVKAFKPSLLHDVIHRVQNMEGATAKNKVLSKPLFPQKGKDKNPFQKEGSRSNRLDEETQKEL